MRELKKTRGSALGRIAARATELGIDQGHGMTPAQVMQCVESYHRRVRRLRLTDMALGRDVNLAHDLGGILGGADVAHWTPRYAAQ